MDIQEILLDGLKEQIKERRKDNSEMEPALRAGNSGILVTGPEGDRVQGSCHRKALLRKLDIQIPVEPSTHKIFEAGLGSEDAVVARLKASKIVKEQGITVLCEEEIPTKWRLEDGTPVTGRPDAVFMKDDEPIAVFELKQKQTANGFQNIVDKDKPDSAHLCQAAHYAWQLGKQTKAGEPIKAYIIYSWPILSDNLQRDKFYKSDLAKEYMEYPMFKPKNPGMAKIKLKPGDKVFELFWNDKERLCYMSPTMKGPVETIITPDAIQGFYEATNSMIKEEWLGPRPSKIHVGEGVSQGYPPCGFCELSDTCDQYEHNYNQWLDEVKKLAAETDWVAGTDNTKD